MINFTQTIFTSSRNSLNKFIALFAFLLVGTLSFGQADDFTDGNFTASPVWSGDTADFSIQTATPYATGGASTDGSYLASGTTNGNVTLTTPSTEVSEWKFSLGSGNFAPSDTNYFGVILMSSAPITGSITGTSWNGYFLKIGAVGSGDLIELWKKNGAGSGTKVGDFPASPVVASAALITGRNFRVTRSASGVFELFYSNGFTYAATPTTSAGTLTDNTVTTSSYFGVYSVFANPSAARRLFIDNIVLGSSPIVNGTIAAGEYGVHTNGSNQETNTITWYNTWDTNNLYFGIGATNNNSNESAVIYIDMNPITPVNGGSDTNGTNAGFSAYDRATYNPPFRADFVLYFKNGYYEYRTANGAGGWNTQVITGLTYSQSGAGAGQAQEISIPWSAITGGSIPASFNWHAFKIYDNNATNNGIYGQVPANNPGGAQNLTAYTLSANRYYTVSSTTSGSSTLPFSRVSYCQPLGTTSNNFGTASFWDFTVNPGAGFQVARSNAGGDWTISGNLVVGSGVLYFGSGGSAYGQSTIGNVNVIGGLFDMDQTNKTMNVSGGITIGSGGTFKLSGTIGGDVSIAGNWLNNGTFTPSSRLVTFNGTTAQTLTGATIFDFLTLNNTTGLTLANSVVVNQTLGLTNGKLTLGANDLTVGSAGTITGANTTNYIVTNGVGQLKRTVGASNTIFTVGNSAYNPITLNNSGSSDVYGIVAVDGTFATPNDNTRIVNRRWQITEAVAGGSNLAIQAQYNTGEPAANFATATTPYIGYYNGSVWSQVGATLSGANPFVASSTANSTPSDLTTGTNYFAIGKDAAFIPLPATKFVITSISPATPQAGSAFNVTVQAQNAVNVASNVIANTSFTLTTNGNAGAISGAVTGTIVAGTNTIVVSGVILGAAGTGATITATQTAGDALTAGTSAPFNVLAGADRLAFVGVPATGNINANLSTFTVQARRPDNSVDTGYNSTITIAKASGPGNLTGTVSVLAVNGIATFSTAQFDAIGTYTLTTTSGALTADTSSSIVITLVPTVIAQFDFTPFTLPTADDVTIKDANVSVTDFGISAGTLSVGVTTGTVFPNPPYVAGSGGYTSTTQAGAKNFNFTINANLGYKIEVTNFQFNSLATAAGPSAISYNIANGASVFTANAPDTALLPVNQTVSGVNNLTSIPVLIQGWLNGSRTTAGTGNFRIDDVIVRGYVTCIDPSLYAVTGGGTGCATTGVAVGLANSQVGINYQLKIGGVTTGSPVAGTGAAISFGNQLVAGTYTVEASNTNGTCNLTQTMTGSVVVTLDPASVAGTVSTDQSICENTQPTDITVTGSTGTIQWESSTDNVAFTPISGQTAATLTGASIGNLTTTTYYRAVVTSGTCPAATSAVVTVTVNPIVAASVSIAAAPSNLICTGTSVTFTATPTNGGSTPTYQWRVNGSDVSGETAATFTTSTLTNGAVVTVVMTSNAPCVTGSPATSAGITMQVSNPVGYANLQFPPSGTICQGGTYTVYGQVFQAGVTPGAGAGAGITVEFGYNGTNTNPATWTNWFTAGYGSDVGNNDEYVYNFTPSLDGVYYYTFRYKSGACDWQYGGYSGSGGGFWNGTTNVNGVLTVNTNAAHTISLTSGLGTNVQSFCQNTALPTTITYAVGGGATGAGVTGLPAGMSGVYNAGVFTISGTPTASGVFNYTVTTTGNGCATAVTETGTLTISSTIDYANLQFPGSQTVCEGASFTAYGQVFEPGVTPGAGVQGSGITVEFGYDAANTNPATWTNWFAASFNPAGGGTNNDEYQYTFTAPTNGTFYYTFRYKQGTCDWQYGGYNAGGGGFWNGTTNVNGVLTVNPLATASITGNNGPICSGANATFSLTGTSGAVVTYNINGGANTTVTLTGGTATVTVTGATATQTLNLVSVTNGVCPATLTGSSTVTVNPLATASITGNNGPICSGADASFTLVGTSGAVVTYNINGGANTTVTLTGGTATVTVTGATANQTLNLVSVTDGICPATLTGSSTVTVNPLPTASISGNNGPVVCTGSAITFTLVGTSGAVVTYNINGGANTTATLTGGTATVTVTGATATQTLNLVSVTDGVCPATLTGSSTVVIESTTWDGTAWSNGQPTSTKSAIFTGNFTIAADFEACTISVSNNAVVSVTSGFNVSLNGAISVATGSSFTLNNNANLYQANPAAVNTGNVIVKRQSNPLIRLDYTLWSSPVAGQGLYAFSPFTFANRFYNYNTTTNFYSNTALGMNVVGTNAAGVNGTDTNNVPFGTGKGYLIRLPYNHPTAPIVWNGSFTGVPNNGTKTIALDNVSATQQYNLVGNPYPSPISIAQFATDNAANIEPTLYFWRKTNNAASPSYCTWNTTSGLFGDNGEAYTNSPNGVIQTGQGFFVEAKDGASSLEFNNGQRVVNNANQFFRTTTVATPTTQPDVVWLNLTGTGAEFSQAVVSYFANATLGADAYDSKYFNDGPVALNMIVDGSEYVIQGRPSFVATDVVPLNYKVATAGNYTFAIDHVDGVFTGGAQAVFIKDNQDGSYHNLSTPYTFTSAAGTFANRFELVYQTALANNDNSFTANSINVIKQQNDVVVRTAGTTMQEVTIYDIRGRVLVTKTNINANETKINVGTTNQVLLVQVTTVDGVKATKKVVN